MQEQRRAIEPLDGRRSATMLPRKLARIHAFKANLFLQLLGPTFGLRDGDAALFELGHKRALPFHGFVPAAAQRAQIVHRKRKAQIGELGR